MKFLLGSDKGFVSFVVKSNVSEDSTDNERSDNFDRWINSDWKLGFGEFEFGSRNLLEVDFKCSDEGSFGK